ncbi:major tail protein [Nodularia phage vB_NspS-kac65v151]|jgi:hypothetical protein|uniref:Major tail protein n=5 Tax=Ravarandavirus TaxID=2843444 RepID=A0A482MJX5_9CAUD|nr:major tail protein [Nodularia phage vB_NpeS-2AV2]YP_009844639.1 major tail protein [Nodularia phage vB_NspS-kac65v151]YP_009844849.1 major tail protein [Nodularia phage vB_NspS-kac68v161]QBQ73274.1 major tail protein [Nodularia phage vB_NspS-kac65v161]QBQ73888.1 major tail protein [Nodularia phage vB_NspS-kac68v162]ALY07486.1 major tail protein [Nodularia phage vB_NpeS-2AV2]QBQ73068.1 major tail protein [Nodularia phage vB_NspS-kac65v151]QBQ73690.1 major tail protein [Nodularia phage vB_N
MSDAKYGLRTITRSLIYRQVEVSDGLGGFVTASLPIPEIVGAVSLVIDPGIQLLELPGVNCKGEEVIELTVPKSRLPTMQIEYSVGAPEMDSLIHGKIISSQADFVGDVYFEAVADTASIPARISGQAGFSVTPQAAATSTAQVYYVDPVTHLAKKLEIADGTPAGDQITIGAALAITLSPELVATGAIIRGWVPCTFTAATAITNSDVRLVGVKAMGVDFGGKFAGFSARNCSLLYGAALGSDPKKSIKLRILPDQNDGTGLGFQMFYTNEDLVC